MVYWNYIYQLLQTLHYQVSKRFDLSFNSHLIIQNSTVFGDIPQDYCKLLYGNLQLQNNDINGTAPSCYVCLGYTLSKYITDGNNLSNLSPVGPLLVSGVSKLSTCNMFVNPDKSIVKTRSDIITITGTDLGWEWIINGNIPKPNFVIFNQKLTIQIPIGTGSNIIKKYSIFNNQYFYNLQYSYEQPVIQSSSIATGSTSTIQLVGNGFSYFDNDNILNINGVNYTIPSKSIMYPTNKTLDSLSFNYQQLTGNQLPVAGSKLSLTLYVGDQNTNYQLTISSPDTTPSPASSNDSSDDSVSISSYISTNICLSIFAVVVLLIL